MKKLLLLSGCLFCSCCAGESRSNGRDALVAEGFWSYSNGAIVIVRDAQTGKRFIASTHGYILEIK